MTQDLISALNSIDVAALTRDEWLRVGMALKEDGRDVSVWDDWSRNDSRYRAGECERLWASFRGSSKPVTVATVFQMAQERGWQAFGESGIMDWNDEIIDDGDNYCSTPYGSLPRPSMTPSEELITYLSTLFRPDEYVGYVTDKVWQDGDGRWVPSKGDFDRTASELIKAIRKYGDDLGGAIGDWKSDTGAWIRFNPVDGTGVKNENITAFRFALVESDNMTLDEQYNAFTSCELPIACLVHSGGKSLHAIVHIDAADYSQYRERVEFLYKYLSEKGVQVDTQNRNPSRLSRMPGVTRKGTRQYLVAYNIGRKTWVDWLDWLEGESSELPPIVSITDVFLSPPPLAPELICGLLRQGHKMLVSGASKAGKSFFLIELAIAISEGRCFLGFECNKAKTLYINLEIDDSSCYHRFIAAYEALGIKSPSSDMLRVWNLRGRAMPLNKLVPKLVARVKDQNYGAIIVDPIYKVIMGDENNASEMGAFCNQFDKICDATGSSVIYAHHHSKGAQGGKSAQDRNSGSGVFARDPDAIVDLVELELNNDIIDNVVDAPTDTAWQMEMVAREFKQPSTRKIWFKYPLHTVDSGDNLKEAYPRGSEGANLAKSSKRTNAAYRKETLDHAYEMCSLLDPVKATDLAEFAGVSEKTIRRYISEFSDDYSCENGVVKRL